MPTPSMMVCASATARMSAQISALRSGRARRSTTTHPIIWPLKVMQAISLGCTLAAASSCRVEAHTACHQSSGFCSTQLTCGSSRP